MKNAAFYLKTHFPFSQHPPSPNQTLYKRMRKLKSSEINQLLQGQE